MVEIIEETKGPPQIDKNNQKKIIGINYATNNQKQFLPFLSHVCWESVCLFLYLCICVFICVYVLYICLFVYLNICVFVYFD